MKLFLFSLFMISYFVHLTSRIPVLGAIRFDVLLGALLLVAIICSQEKDKWRASIVVTKKLNMFFCYIFLSLPFVTWPGSVINNNLMDWVKTAIIFVFVVSVVRTEKQLKWGMFVFLSCQTFRILEPLYLHVTTGYWGSIAYSHVEGSMVGLNRLSGAPYDIVNPNQLAWIIVTTIPFLFYLLWLSGKVGKLLFLSAMPFFVHCLILTGSRSGVLSLGAVIAGIIYYSKKRLKNLMIAMAIVIPAAIYVFSNTSSGLQTRYESIYSSDVVGADTAHGRINALLKQIGSISNNPLFGNGLGTSGETNFNITGSGSQVTHNLYIEILQETGIIGLTLFIVYVVAIINILKEAKATLIRSGRDDKDWLFRLTQATQVWVFMDLFYSLSCFGLRSWEWYFFGGVATLCLVFALESCNKATDENHTAYLPT